MSIGVRKPREFWIIQERGSNRCLIRDPGEKWSCDVNGEPHSGWIRCKEILPGDDSIRVSREDWETIKRIMVPSAISVSRKLTDPYGIIERIERENPPKQDEGK